MSQLFRPRANTFARLIIAAIALSPVVALIIHVSLMNTPHFTNQNDIPMQPMPFSHVHHVRELGIDCRYCHNSAQASDQAGLPTTHICATCHSQLFTHQQMLAPVRVSMKTKTPIRWNEVNRLPDYVYFNHAVHVNNGIGCTTCHGDVANEPLIRQAKRLTMGWCLACHRNPGRFVRKPSEVFAVDWQPDNNPQKVAALMKHYMIDTRHLTDCSTCHR